NPFFESVRFDSIHGEVRVDAREARLIDLSGFVDNNINSIQARLGLRRDEEGLVRIGEVNPFSGKMNGKNFDLRLLDSFMPESMSAEGRASFNVAWNGTVAEPHINGDMSLLQGAFTIEQKKRLLHNLNLVTSVYDSVLVIESITGYYNSMSFTGSGALNASRMRRYSGNFEIVLPDHGKMHVDGSISSDSLSIAAVVNELDLKLFQPLIPAVDKFSGRCDLQLDVGGTTKDPVVMGSMEIDHLTATYSQWNMEFSEGYARLNFERDVIRIDSLYTRLNSGTIVSEGRLYLDDNTINALDVHVRADSIDVKVKDEFEVSLKRADIRYETQKDVHVLQGEAVFGESKILYNFSPTSILPFARRVEKPARALPDLLNKTRMNVKIREGDHLWVDNNLARIRLYPELTVYGYLSGINLRGRVTAIEGYVLYLDRKFNMKTGTVDFVDPNRINPNIDIEAVAALKSYQTFDDKDYTITLSISGLLDQAEVKLTSDPELGKSDILALLTLGFTRDQLSGNHMGNGQETKVSDLIKARLEMYSSQRISYFASQKVGNLFGLESMSIEGNLFDFGSSWGPQLVASKKITNRIQLTYDTSVGELNQQGIRLDYRIKNNLYIQGQTDQSGRSAIDLKFGIKFK
ncbi:translocation/assembly module TamB domain-containing protein, partial [candidate division KSB1 bacterium]|nr:translocation/assembly module TamB domain-containing protein [candidate division KSB1 bacterium]